MCNGFVDLSHNLFKYWAQLLRCIAAARVQEGALGSFCLPSWQRGRTPNQADGRAIHLQLSRLGHGAGRFFKTSNTGLYAVCDRQSKHLVMHVMTPNRVGSTPGYSMSSLFPL